ncbi:sensor histidine kinase [Oscillatoria salina]|uniref:sensor histidine kinase n=1 Tax=Oscillatoria salina TaxID=331517 RepID=UPI001CCBC0EB|nr:ATP-binding protein [Oscillatoria salina]
MSQPKSPELYLAKTSKLTLESTLQELSLYDFQIELSSLGKEVAYRFNTNPLIPGVILTRNRCFVGIISRRHFLEIMSRPYGIELFFKRPLNSLYDFTHTDVLILSGNTLIVEAAKLALQRHAELIYEPIVVQLEPQVFRLIDIHQLLIAQSNIHELTTRLLDEKTQAHLVQTEKMASLGRMIAGIAHEIRNPVNSINGNSEFLGNYCEDLIGLVAAYQREFSQKPPKIKEIESEIELDFLLEDLPKILQSMKLGAEKLTQIVASFRNFSRMDDKKRQVFDIHESIDGTLLILNNNLKKGIQVIKNYGELPAFFGYSGLLSQVFMNIIANAIDALMDKQLEADKNWQPQIIITTNSLENEAKKWIVIKIADNGPGIPLEIQEKIFENFFTTKPLGKGTGLGLAISNQIVTEKHGGKLQFNSQLDVGTAFEIILPVDEETNLSLL